jgi:hypothetical protein
VAPGAQKRGLGARLEVSGRPWAPQGDQGPKTYFLASKADFADPPPWSRTGDPNSTKIGTVATQTAMFYLTDRWVALGVILVIISVPIWCPLALEKTVQSVQVSVFSSFGPLLDGDLFQDHFLHRFLVDLGGHLAPKRDQIGPKNDFWKVRKPM